MLRDTRQDKKLHFSGRVLSLEEGIHPFIGQIYIGFPGDFNTFSNTLIVDVLIDRKAYLRPITEKVATVKQLRQLKNA